MRSATVRARARLGVERVPAGVYDAVIALAITAVSLLLGNDRVPAGWSGLDPPGVALTCAVNLPLAARRRFPSTLCLLALALWTVYVALDYWPVVNSLGPLLALCTVAALHPMRQAVLCALLLAAVWNLAGTTGAESSWATVLWQSPALPRCPVRIRSPRPQGGPAQRGTGPADRPLAERAGGGRCSRTPGRSGCWPPSPPSRRATPSSRRASPGGSWRHTRRGRNGRPHRPGPSTSSPGGSWTSSGWWRGGLSDPGIAQALVISESTAKTHLNRTMAELGIGSRAQAVVLAYETGLVVPGGGGPREPGGQRAPGPVGEQPGARCGGASAARRLAGPGRIGYIRPSGTRRWSGRFPLRGRLPSVPFPHRVSASTRFRGE